MNKEKFFQEYPRSRRSATVRQWLICLAGLTTTALIVFSFKSPESISSMTQKITYGPPRTHQIGKINLTESILQHVTHPLPDPDILPTLGNPALHVRMGAYKIYEDASGEVISNEGLSLFNPSILPLPAGSKWEYVGAIRTQREVRVRDVIVVDFKFLAVGLNMTQDGQLVAVSDALILDIPNPSPRAAGVVDPRLFYTNAGTPGMTFVRTENFKDQNHGGTMFFVEDLRDLFPALEEAMATSDLIPPRRAVRDAGWKVARGLVRVEGMQETWEKNWQSLYHGAMARDNSLLPTFIYRGSPLLPILPNITSSNRHSIKYDDIPLPSDMMSDCMARVHSSLVSRGTAEIRGSAGLSRLTLCPRGHEGCVPDESNTVRVGVMHVREGQVYYHFMVTFNVSSPFEPISIGPQFKLSNLDDGALLFIVSLNLVINPSQTSGEASGQSRGVLPDHLFLDDELMMGFGRFDNEAFTTVTTMKEVLMGHRLCRDV